MSVTAKPLIDAQFAQGSGTSAYTANSVRTIIDKFTAFNSDSGSQTISINIVKFGDTLGDQNGIVKVRTMTAGQTLDITEMQLQMLNPGDQVYVGASVASKVAIRMSGREIA